MRTMHDTTARQTVRKGLKRLDHERRTWFGMVVRNANGKVDVVDVVQLARTLPKAWIRGGLKDYAAG